MEIGTRIKNLRQKKGMTQRQLADAAGVAPSHLGLVETGRIRMPKAELAARIARALGTTVERLVEKGKVA